MIVCGVIDAEGNDEYVAVIDATPVETTNVPDTILVAPSAYNVG